MTYDLTGKMTGNIKVIVNIGFLSDGEIEQVIEGKTVMTPEGIEDKTLGWPIKFTSNISFSTTKTLDLQLS